MKRKYVLRQFCCIQLTKWIKSPLLRSDATNSMIWCCVVCKINFKMQFFFHFSPSNISAEFPIVLLSHICDILHVQTLQFLRKRFWGVLTWEAKTIYEIKNTVTQSARRRRTKLANFWKFCRLSVWWFHSKQRCWKILGILNIYNQLWCQIRNF